MHDVILTRVGGSFVSAAESKRRRQEVRGSMYRRTGDTALSHSFSDSSRRTIGQAGRKSFAVETVRVWSQS